ncbi:MULTISPECIES: NAD-dependent epimerase [unclassified Bradyrhizobium]|uniref:NAD-dependent epimerase n=1 Tax=unclassified Bradyrhizobium TaxID=2631580 RepID=UPI001FF2FEAF|nr:MULTISPECIES: NAD-dependent epimerase [unclassified Bradyrhizobium]MCJ9700062.1 NAD-dependent epimerase [Bradyrhizobium sp. SHOUNA76]MCJ9729088.1 NAD-dependent epimerase [Bradyrhizobium sp. PRIMUS42]
MKEGSVLLTGAAGFIGFHVARRLLQLGRPVVGLDNLNDYYDPSLKEARLAILREQPHFRFVRQELADESGLKRVFAEERFPVVIHLAAQAGVRYSLQNPQAYISSNLQGFANVLEACRHHGCEHLLYASSSSVYGANTKLPFSVRDSVDHPVSLYAATKKSNELMAHAYSHLFGLPTTGLRFFTVYGPWGRPDMAMYIFTRAILEGRPIKLFNHGKMRRDFTYVDDIVEAIVRLADRPAVPNASATDSPNLGSSAAPWRIYNIGNNRPEDLTHVVAVLERELGRSARCELVPMEDGDVPATFADVDDLMRDIGFQPSTPIEEGIAKFVRWYRGYHVEAHASGRFAQSSYAGCRSLE